MKNDIINLETRLKALEGKFTESENPSLINSIKPHVLEKIEVTNNKKRYTRNEQRIINALMGIGGKGKVNDMCNYLKKSYPEESEQKLHSSIRQYASSLGNKGEIGVEKIGGNQGNIYSLKVNIQMKHN